MTNCECKRVKDPSGIWEIDNLIGAKVYIKSMAVSNFFQFQDADVACTISSIKFRVSIDGKAITIIELKEYPGKTFTWKDLSISELIIEEES